MTLDNPVNTAPLVSIIAIAYNHASYLEEALDSIVAQTYKRIELIIVDAFSKDESVELIQKWTKRNPSIQVKTIFQPETKKITENANDALKFAKGDYFQILSCDDILMPDKIESQIRVFQEEDSRLAVVYSNASKIDTNSSPLDVPTFFEERNWHTSSQLPSGQIFPLLLMDYFLVAPTVLVRKDYALQVGGYNPELMMEDLDLFLKLAQYYSFKGINQIHVKYRILESSLLRSSDAFSRQSTRLKIYSHYLDQNGEWDRYIIHQFLIAHKTKSLWFKLLYFVNSVVQKILKSRFKKLY